jgi:hypothetical protein
MKQKMLLRKNVFVILLLIASFFLLLNHVSAQETFPPGGSSFDNAVEIKPGQYTGGELGWEDETITQRFYYLTNIKSGQAIEAATKFLGNTNLDVSLYDSSKVKLIDVYGGDNIDALAWLVGSPTKTDKYYLVLKNDAVEVATNISLDLKVSDRYDAGSSTDAGNTITEALAIVPGSYQGYFSGEQGNDEKDFYSLKLKKGKQVSVKITPPSKDSINLAVYDVNRAKLDENTSTDTGEITTLVFTPANDGNYYLEASCNYGCAKIVNYQMTITGATLPTGGGLIVTTSTPAEITPGAPGTGQTDNGQQRDRKFMFMIGLTVLAIIIIVYLILRNKTPEKNEPPIKPGIPDSKTN